MFSLFFTCSRKFLYFPALKIVYPYFQSPYFKIQEQYSPTIPARKNILKKQKKGNVNINNCKLRLT